jgi:hypothetical protein
MLGDLGRGTVAAEASGRGQSGCSRPDARRNPFVAALADEVWFARIAPGGQTEQLAKTIARWPPTSTP